MRRQWSASGKARPWLRSMQPTAETPCKPILPHPLCKPSAPAYWLHRVPDDNTRGTASSIPALSACLLEPAARAYRSSRWSTIYVRRKTVQKNAFPAECQTLTGRKHIKIHKGTGPEYALPALRYICRGCLIFLTFDFLSVPCRKQNACRAFDHSLS